MGNSATTNLTAIASIVLWVIVVAALLYGVVQTGIDASALFTA
ncbi:MFS transporter small subunit [Nocardiopsis nanhaiensis]